MGTAHRFGYSLWKVITQIGLLPLIHFPATARANLAERHVAGAQIAFTVAAARHVFQLVGLAAFRAVFPRPPHLIDIGCLTTGIDKFSQRRGKPGVIFLSVHDFPACRHGALKPGPYQARIFAGLPPCLICGFKVIYEAGHSGFSSARGEASSLGGFFWLTRGL